MTSEALAIDWDHILDEFSSYDGTIKSFCEKHNISHHQLYYRRKRLENNNTVFHGINFNEKENIKETNNQINSTDSFKSSNIKIEVGKAKIHIPNNDKVALSNILEVIMESC
jgi:hypothetical protein